MKRFIFGRSLYLSARCESTGVYDRASKQVGHVPFGKSDLVAKDMQLLTSTITRLLGTNNSSLLNRIACHYFNPGTISAAKHVRPLILLLVSQATNIDPASTSSSISPYTPVNNPAVTPDIIPNTPDIPPFFSIDAPLGKFTSDWRNQTRGHSLELPLSPITARQRRLCQIIEMIHTASLLHDDVIDNADTRRSVPTPNATNGNKMAILAGK